MTLEERQDDPVLLRDVETKRYFPWNLVVTPLSKGNIKASLSVGEAGEIPTDLVGNVGYVWHEAFPERVESFLLIARTPRIVTAAIFGSKEPSDEYLGILGFSSI
jgi:hypothetical protein